MLKTEAILLWLADQHGALATKMGQLERDPFLTWLFWLSNTMHPTLRQLFFPETYLAQPTEEALQDLRKAPKSSLAHLLTLINQEIGRKGSQRSTHVQTLSSYTQWFVFGGSRFTLRPMQKSGLI